MKTSLTEAQEQQIVEKLNNQYGEEGEDWAGGKLKVKGEEKFVAVKAPSSDAWLMFKTNRDEHYTKLALNKRTNIKLDQVVEHLIIDCLITDVEGCLSLQEYKKVCETKPALAEHLQEMIHELHNSGLQGLKKNQ